MGAAERKIRERAERAHRIVAAARQIAERDGWDAVTIRRLADEIEYSQPVLYAHFDNRDAIIAAVAVEGFAELAVVLREAADGACAPHEALSRVATAYLAFALRCPALYAAMFTLPTRLRFAVSGTPAQARSAFGVLAAVVGPFHRDVDLVTETLWAALHGLAELERSGRIRAGMRDDRIALMVAMLTGSGDEPEAGRR